MYLSKLQLILSFLLIAFVACGVLLGYCLHDYLKVNNEEAQFDMKEYKEMNSDQQSKTLKFVTAIFRHGERVPEPMSNYPTNPYRNYSYFPYSPGDLTHKGQLTLIKRGLSLKRRYQSLLDQRYYNGLITSIASSYIRCQVSLQAVHAGLFWTEEWNALNGLPWQPVPYQALRQDEDYLSIIKKCSTTIQDIINPEVNETTQALFDYIEKHSGLTNVSFFRTLTMYDITKTNLECGLPPPPWVKSIYPEPLKSVGLQFWRLMAEQKRRTCSGPIFMNMIEHAKHLAAGKSKAKMLLYSAHDITINNVLNALNAWRCDDIAYGAVLLFELHEIDDLLGFKVYFDNNNNIEQIAIPFCGSFCPLSQFERIMEPLYNPTPNCD